MVTIVAVIVVGAICLGIGYLLGKKQKVKKQLKDVLDRI